MVTCRLSVPISLAGYATSILVTVVTSTLWSATATEASTGTTGSTAATLRPLRSSLSVGSSIERNQPCPSSLPSLLPPSDFHFLHPSVPSLARWFVDPDGRLVYWCYTNITSPQHVFLPTTRGKKDKLLTAGTMRRKRPVWWQPNGRGAVKSQERCSSFIMIIAVAVSMVNFCMIFDE